MKKVGQIQQITRYPIKSMAGVDVEYAELGWNGISGDRRFAVHRLGDQGRFPWVSASKLPELLLYQPCEFHDSKGEPVPSMVTTPSGEKLEVYSEELRVELSGRLGFEIDLMRLTQGIFDDSPIALISESTISHVCKSAGVAENRQRFRANFVVVLDDPGAFGEDAWIGGEILMGKEASFRATKRDVRCKMIGLDPTSTQYDPSVLKTVVDLNANNAGIYGAVTSTGTIRVGDEVFLTES